MGQAGRGAGHERGVTTLVERAHAKLNLTLEVLGRRADGYHEVVSVMQTISLCDELTLEPAAEISVHCDVAGLNGEDNLALQAARLLRAHCPGTAGARISLRKGIPVASGLGGGSSDAAATLRALNRLWGAGLAPSELRTLGASLGSDVPFFIEGGTALARGHGELVEALPSLRQQWFIVVRPPLDVSAKTAAMYAMLPASAWTTGRATAHLAAALRAGRALREAALFNAFSNLAAAAFPEIGMCRQDLLEAAWSRPVLAGAGPSLFILVGDRAQGEDVAAALGGSPCRAWVAHSVAPGYILEPA